MLENVSLKRNIKYFQDFMMNELFILRKEAHVVNATCVSFHENLFFAYHMQKGGFCMNNQDFSFVFKEMSKIPYPELVNVEPDYKFGRLVYDSYAGGKSELTTILSYVFQYLTNEDTTEVAMFLMMIAKQEMKHLELLGEILVSLGLEPYYMSTYGNKWCSDNVRTTFRSLEEMLMFNIGSEKEAIQEYKHLMNVCGNESIKAVLARIIMDEENHVQIFEMLKNKYEDCGCKD